MAAWKQSACAGDCGGRAVAPGCGSFPARRTAGPLGHRLGQRSAGRSSRSRTPPAKADARRGAADRRRRRPGDDRHHQRPPVGDRHRPRQRFGRRQSLCLRPPDRNRRRVRQPASRPATSSRGSIPRPRRSRSTAPRSRSTMPQAAPTASKRCAAPTPPPPSRSTDAELAVENARLALRDARTGAGTPLHPGADRRHRRHPAGRGRQLRHRRDGDRHDRRPLARIIVDFWVPERFAGAIAVGAAGQATPIARPERGAATARSAPSTTASTRQSRTLLVRARIANPTTRCAPACRSRSPCGSPATPIPSVDPLAIQWGTDGAFVWAVRDGKAERMPVRIIQRNTENVLVDAELDAATRW